jgi:hypothetical protein
MSILEQTDRDPYARVKPLGEDPPPPKSGAEAEYTKKMLEEHTAFRNSPMGKAALAIAVSEINRLQKLLSAPIEAFPRKHPLQSLDLINEARAEARGEMMVWVKILSEPEFLVARKAKLEEKNKNKS